MNEVMGFLGFLWFLFFWWVGLVGFLFSEWGVGPL